MLDSYSLSKVVMPTIAPQKLGSICTDLTIAEKSHKKGGGDTFYMGYSVAVVFVVVFVLRK